MRIQTLVKLWMGVGVLSVAATAASAQPLEASLSLVSDPGDYIGGGQSRAYTLDTAAITTRSGQNGGYFGLTVFPFEGGWWYVDLAAPAGSQLVPGAYENAVRWPFQGLGQPGLSITGNGAGCNTVTGRFDVLDVAFGPNGYIERFHAQFEQHCEGAGPALRGEVLVVNPPPPPALQITLSVNENGKVDRVTGKATVTGTVTCTIAVPVNLSGSLAQRLTRFALVTAYGYAPVPCTPEGVAWAITFQPQGSVPFGAGMAQAMLSATGYDNYYGNIVIVGSTPAIKLTPK